MRVSMKNINGIITGFRHKLSVFWQFFIFMSVLVFLFIMVQLYSNHKAEENIIEQYSETLGGEIRHTAEIFGNNLNMTSGITTAIADTKAYAYLIGQEKGTPYTYSPVLSMLRDAMQDLWYTQNGSLDTICYVPKMDASFSRTHVSLETNGKFADNVFFENPENDSVGNFTSKSKFTYVIPVQNVTVGDKSYRAMAIVSRMLNNDLVLLSLYTEDTILKGLNYENLPEGTRVELRCEGSTVLKYPDTGLSDSKVTGFMEYSYGIPQFGMTLEMKVPEKAVLHALTESRRSTVVLTALTFVLGIFLCLLLSKKFVIPIRRILLPMENGEETLSKNEYDRLENAIKVTQDEVTDIREQFRSVLITKALSGMTLSREEQAQLNKQFPLLENGSYRVAVFHSDEDFNASVRKLMMGGEKREDYPCEILGMNETALIYADTEENSQLIQKSFKVLTYFAKGKELACGISGPIRKGANLHIAVRQAHAALPLDNGIKEYNGISHAESSNSWIRNERMYQNIMSNNRDKALELLKEIANDRMNPDIAREVYYSVLMILKNAAEEMNVERVARYNRGYEPTLRPKENILCLEVPMKEFFQEIRLRQENRENQGNETVVSWIRDNAVSSNLTIHTVSEKFDIHPNRVYEIVREQTGLSLHNYILSIRMKKASLLLASTELGVSEVAQACGYDASCTFHRVFKKYYGVTPAEYRSGGFQSVKGEEVQSDSLCVENNT